jgi:hypothetical protein
MLTEPSRPALPDRPILSLPITDASEGATRSCESVVSFWPAARARQLSAKRLRGAKCTAQSRERLVPHGVVRMVKARVVVAGLRDAKARVAWNRPNPFAGWAGKYISRCREV